MSAGKELLNAGP